MADRVELVGLGRRRRWSVEDKLRLVAESGTPGASVSEVARRNDLSPGLLFTWRRMAAGRAARSSKSVALVQVHVGEAAPPAAVRERRPRAPRMEIGLPGGVNLKVDAGVDPEALAAVVAVLRRR